MNYIGVDGCSAGWFYVSMDDYNNCEYGFFTDFQYLSERFHEDCLILVDIPIGLRENREQCCDKEARTFLEKPRKSSVFRVPCRKAVYESNPEEAKRINQELTGKSLPKQTLAILNKIKQVDELLKTSIKHRKLVREIHPEICFWSLNGRKSLQYKKSSTEGFNERLDVIRNVYGGCDELVKDALSKFKRCDVAKDDVLDALIGAVTARFGYNSLKTIPDAKTLYDEMGLPMEMVYFLPKLD
jgi:predicted RNase H-like nuclease